MDKKNERPKFCTNKHLEYLDELRESGETNMFGARPYLASTFPELTEDQSREVLSYWMSSFGERHAQKA